MEDSPIPRDSCPHCNSKISSQAKFCSQCGKLIQSTLKRPQQIKLWSLILPLALSIPIGSAVYFWQSELVGQRPSGAPPEIKQPAQFDHADGRETKKLREPEWLTAELQSERIKVTENESAEAWRQYAKKLGETYDGFDSPPNDLTLELLEALTQLLKLSPGDPEALLAVGNLSFDRRVFQKAAEYYSRYLEIDPTNKIVRARYGSALGFTGDSEKAVTVLESLRTEQPEDFHTLAFLSVAYAQQGNMTKASEVGDVALNNAPSEEARNRFQAFLSGLKNSPSDNTGESVQTPPQSLESFFKGHPITGPKFDRLSEDDDGKIKVFLHDFPVHQMPPFARDKFVEKIKDLLPGEQVLDIIDTESGEVLLSVSNPDRDNR